MEAHGEEDRDGTHQTQQDIIVVMVIHTIVRTIVPIMLPEELVEMGELEELEGDISIVIKT